MDFYSLLYVKPNVLTDELILIGLLTNIENRPQFYFSERRLKLVSKSLSVSMSKGIKNSLIGISNEIDDLNKMPNSLPLFDHAYSYDIIKKTSAHNKNVLIYGAPCEVVKSDLVTIEALVKSLFTEKYSEKITIKTPSFRSKWLQYLKKIDHPFTRKFTLSSEFIETIYSSHQVDLIGLFNERIYSFHSIDFNSSPKTIEKNIFEYSRLLRGIEVYGKSKGLKIGTHYLVYEHPKKKMSKEVFYKAESDTSKGFSFLRMKDFERELKTLRIKGDNEIENLFL
jgi:hypothetical protein